MIKKVFKTIKVQQNHTKLHSRFGVSLRFALEVAIVLFILISISFAEEISGINNSAGGNTSVVQDLHLKGNNSITYQFDPNGQILVFDSSFSMTVGPTEFSSDEVTAREMYCRTMAEPVIF